jgi:hypothetical protein
MLDSLTIQNFRGFDHFEISGLNRITLLTGKNNSGKTSVLEAIWCATAGGNPLPFLSLNPVRGIQSFRFDSSRVTETIWDSLFTNFDNQKVIEISAVRNQDLKLQLEVAVVHDSKELAKLEGGQVVQVVGAQILGQQFGVPSTTIGPQGQFPSNPTPLAALRLTSHVGSKTSVSHQVIDGRGSRIVGTVEGSSTSNFYVPAVQRTDPTEVAENFGRLVANGSADELVKALRSIEPAIRSVTVIVVGGIPLLHADIGLSRLIPLWLMGEGVNRAAVEIVNIINAPKGTVLIDEFENGIHYSALPAIWKAIYRSAKANSTQVIASTHSRECVQAAQEAVPKTALTVSRIERTRTGEVEAVRYDRNSLKAALDAGLEIR